MSEDFKQSTKTLVSQSSDRETGKISIVVNKATDLTFLVEKLCQVIPVTLYEIIQREFGRECNSPD